jgi:CRISPR system Cascade subunit CasE
MAEMYLSRARLRKDAPSVALAEIFLPEDVDTRVSVTHKLLWTLFSDGPDRKRDFLWREAEPGLYFVLSARPPHDEHNLFVLDPPKPFAPALAVGDRLAFSLRANPTVSRKGTGKRSKRHDVVMNAIKPIAGGERAEKRTAAIQEAGLAWLGEQGVRHGFSIERAIADRYVILRPPHRGAKMRLATLDFEGVLRVTDQEQFKDALTGGLGRAKAYGCGLLLIRRA